LQKVKPADLRVWKFVHKKTEFFYH
jgi:hypothetical protein